MKKSIGHTKYCDNPRCRGNCASDSNSTEISSCASFNYVNIVGEECKGWLNLFFGDECIAMVSDVELANRIRKITPEKKYPKTHLDVDDGFEEFTPY